MVSAFPDVHIRERDGKESMIIMGCDGVWETKEEKEIFDFVQKGQEILK